MVEGTVLAAVLLRRFLASDEFDDPGVLTVKFWSGSTLISLRAIDISCCTSGHCSFSSFKTCDVRSGVCGTAVYCCKGKMRTGVKPRVLLKYGSTMQPDRNTFGSYV